MTGPQRTPLGGDSTSLRSGRRDEGARPAVGLAHADEPVNESQGARLADVRTRLGVGYQTGTRPTGQ